MRKRSFSWLSDAVPRGLGFALGFLAMSACAGPSKLDPAGLIPPQGKYSVKILRDTWGVPHIYGKTDADVAYGLAYAHCEDDFKTIQQGQLLSRGQLASVERWEAAPFDYLIHLFRVREIVDAKYETDLSPEVRAICEAYADGVNHYAALNPDFAEPGVFPARGQDVVAGFVLKTPMFFGLDGETKRLFQNERPAFG